MEQMEGLRGAAPAEPEPGTATAQRHWFVLWVLVPTLGNRPPGPRTGAGVGGGTAGPSLAGNVGLRVTLSGPAQRGATVPALDPCREEGGRPRLCQVGAIFVSRPALPCQQRLGSPPRGANSPAQAHLKVTGKWPYWSGARLPPELLGRPTLRRQTRHNGKR